MKNFQQQGFVLFIPVIVAAAAAIVSWISTFFTVAFTFLVFKLGRVLLSVSLYLAAFTAFALALFAVVDLVTSFSPPVPSELSIAASWILPSNLSLIHI